MNTFTEVVRTDTPDGGLDRVLAHLDRMRAELLASGWTPAVTAAQRAAYDRVRAAYPDRYVACRERWTAARTAVELEVVAVGSGWQDVHDELDRLYPGGSPLDLTVVDGRRPPAGVRVTSVRAAN